MSTEKPYVDVLTERSAGAMAIAEADEGWESVPIDCPMLQAVRDLRIHADALERAQIEAQAQVDTYTLEEALSLARLWSAGKMIGGNRGEVIEVLLREIERLRAG